MQVVIDLFIDSSSDASRAYEDPEGCRGDVPVRLHLQQAAGDDLPEGLPLLQG